MDRDRVDRLLRRQAGVVCRSQVLGAGGADHDIERLLRRREWARMHLGVFVDHTGTPTWRQRAWAATQLHQPAALSGRSALWAHGIGRPDDRAPIELLVDRARRVDDPSGVTTRQCADFERVARLALSPPRVTVEYAALAVAARARTGDAAVAALSEVVQVWRSTPKRLQAELDLQPRLRHRRLLGEVIGDLAAGANSALEQRFLRDVERAHRLPRAERQVRIVQGQRTAYRDAAYPLLGQIIELDGRLGHDGTTDRWDDLERDLIAAVHGDHTVRIGWRQVLEPCRLAEAVAGLLRARGWTGSLTLCGPTCTTGEDLRRLVPEILA